MGRPFARSIEGAFCRPKKFVINLNPYYVQGWKNVSLIGIVANKKTAAKGGKEKAGTKASQGNGAKANGTNGKVKFGQKYLKRWDLSAKPASEKFSRFKTYAFMKQYLEDAIASGKGLKELAAEFKVTSARIYECTKQLGMDLSELKGRAKAAEKTEGK